MSIRHALREAVAGGALKVLELSVIGDSAERIMLLHPNVDSLLQDDDPVRAERVGGLRADLEMFVRGQQISLGMTPFKHKKAYMGLLSPPSDGTWEIRSRAPSPGMRVFGRFAEKDVFVGFTWALRSVSDCRWPNQRPLGSGQSLAYQLQLLEVERLWHEIFPEFGPLKGNEASELLSSQYYCI